MRIPDNIEKALLNRAKAASEFMSADGEIVAFLEENGVCVSGDDILTGCESLVCPYNSIDRIREAIMNK